MMKFCALSVIIFSSLMSCLLITESESKTLNAVFTEWYPYTYLKDGNARGFSIEIYREALRNTGMKIKFQQLPWARAVEEFEGGNFDVILDSHESAGGRCPKKPPVPWVINFWVHNNSKLENYFDFSQMNNKTVGYVRGYTYPDRFNNYDAFGQKVSVTNDIMGLRILDAGRIDAFIGDVLNNAELVKQYQLSVRPLSPAVDLQFLTLCFSTELSQELKEFEASLAAMYRDGRLDNIYKKYFALTYEELITQYGPSKK